MSRKTRFLTALGIALITAGVLELTVGEKYNAYRGKHCHSRWHSQTWGNKDAPTQKPAEQF